MGFKSLKKKSKRDKEFSDISQLSNSDEITDTLNKNFYSRNQAIWDVIDENQEQ